MDAWKKRRLQAWRIAAEQTRRHPPRDDELARLIEKETTYGAQIFDTLLELAEQDEDPEARKEAQEHLRDLVSDALSDP